MSVYENIDRIIKEKRISRRKLARMAGINETTLASCFARRPEHFPSKYAVAIAKVLHVPVWELYDTQPTMVPISEAISVAKALHGATPDELRKGLNELEEKHLDIWIRARQAVNAYMKEDIEAGLWRFLKAYKLLNDDGREQAIKRVEEMTHNDLYRRPVFERVFPLSDENDEIDENDET